MHQAKPHTSSSPGARVRPVSSFLEDWSKEEMNREM